jgi:hypothetical protein
MLRLEDQDMIRSPPLPNEIAPSPCFFDILTFYSEDSTKYFSSSKSKILSRMLIFFVFFIHSFPTKHITFSQTNFFWHSTLLCFWWSRISYCEYYLSWERWIYEQVRIHLFSNILFKSIKTTRPRVNPTKLWFIHFLDFHC